MTLYKDRVLALCAIAAACAITLGCFFVATDRNAWLVKSMIDRVAPWSAPVTCYAASPDPRDYFDAYDDAAGAYVNYVYEIDAVDAAGGMHRAVLVSFGTMLDGEGVIEMNVSGTSVHTWEYVDAAAVPDHARDLLGSL